MFERILVPLDGSPVAEEALPVAGALTDALGLPMHLVRVVVLEPTRTAVVAGGATPRAHLRSRKSTIRAASTYLVDVVYTLRNRGLPATCEMRPGPLIGELLAVIRPGDVVVLATPQHGKIERWWLGSVSKDLNCRAAGPVVVVKAQGIGPCHAAPR